MHVVMGVAVNKVSVECIKRDREVEIIREVTRAIYRWEQGTTSNAINMDDHEMFTMIVILTNRLRCNHPLPSLLMNRVPNRDKPMYKCTVVVSPLVDEWKKEVHPGNTHAPKPIMICIRHHKDSVTVCSILVPWGIWADKLMVHASRSAKVTGSIEPGDSRMVYMYATTELGAISELNEHWVEIRVGVELLKEKASDKLRELWLANVGCQFWKVLGISAFCYDVPFHTLISIRLASQWSKWLTRTCCELDSIHNLWTCNCPMIIASLLIDGWQQKWMFTIHR